MDKTNCLTMLYLHAYKVIKQTARFPFFHCFHIHTHTHTQLKLYAMFNNPDDIKIDDISLGTAVCEDEQKMEYDGTAVKLFLSCGILIPFCVIILLVMIISSSYSKLVNKEQNHANLAALALTGLVFSTFTVVLDILALGNHDFSINYSNINSLFFVMITTVCDAIAVLVAYTALAYSALLYLRYCVFLESQIVWLVILTCFAPLFCIASDSGYIIVAWVSDTQHAGPATFFYIISFLYYFIIFRQLYKVSSKYCSKLHKAKQKAEEPPRPSTNRQTAFNLPAFFIEILLGLILVGVEVFVMYSLTVLPVTVTTAPTDVFHIAQLAFIIITGLFTYKFIYTEDEPKQFMKAFLKYLKKKDNIKQELGLNQLPDAEAAGKVVGKMVYTIMEQNTNTNYRENVSTNMDDTGPVGTQV